MALDPMEAANKGGFASLGGSSMSALKASDGITLEIQSTESISLEEPKSKQAVEDENLKYSPLVSYIAGRYDRARTDRRTDELRWLEAYRNYRGNYSPEVQFTSTEKSRAFIKITKTKVNAAYAQLTEILFSGDRFPIGIESTPIPDGIEASVYFDPKDPDSQTPPAGPQGGAPAPTPPQTSATIARPNILQALGPVRKLLEPIKDKLKSGTSSSPTAAVWEPAKMAAKKMDDKLQDQLAEAGADKSLRAFAFEMSLLGTGVFKGPILRDKEYPKWNEDGTYAPVKKIVADCQSVSLWDAYPDPEARNMEEAEFFIQRHRLSKAQLRALKKRPFFRAESINEAIAAGPDYQEEYWEHTLRDNNNGAPNERYEVLEFWGLADAELKDIADLKVPKEFEGLDEVQINAWICNNRLIRLVFNPFTPARIPYFMCPYEINPYSIFGIGIAENMNDTQLLMNGFMRMAVDNGVLSSNIIFEVNDNNLVPGQDFEIYPGKVFRTNGQVGQSIYATKFPNVTQECMLLFDKARQLADEATGMPSYSHGISGIQSTGRTASGMEMLMGAAKESIKSVIRNIDDYLLVPFGKSLFAFNMQFDFDKDFIGDLEVVAMGTKSLMRNEIRSQKLMQFLQMTANPMDAPFVKRDYLLREVAEAMELEADKVVNDPREATVQAERMKALMLAQGIDPNAQQGSAPAAPKAGGGQGGSVPNPGEQGFSGNTASSGNPGGANGQTQAPKPKPEGAA